MRLTARNQKIVALVWHTQICATKSVIAFFKYQVRIALPDIFFSPAFTQTQQAYLDEIRSSNHTMRDAQRQIVALRVTHPAAQGHCHIARHIGVEMNSPVMVLLA
jgi:hypothetical protein